MSLATQRASYSNQRLGGESAAERRLADQQKRHHADFDLKQFKTFIKEKFNTPSERLIWSRVERLPMAQRIVLKAAVFSALYLAMDAAVLPTVKQVFDQLLTHLERYNAENGGFAGQSIDGTAMSAPVIHEVAPPSVSAGEVSPKSSLGQCPMPPVGVQRVAPPKSRGTADIKGRGTRARLAGGRRIGGPTLPRQRVPRIGDAHVSRVKPLMQKAFNDALDMMGTAGRSIPFFSFPGAVGEPVVDSPTLTQDELNVAIERGMKPEIIILPHGIALAEDIGGGNTSLHRRQGDGFLPQYPQLNFDQGAQNFKPIYLGDTTLLTYTDSQGVPKAVVLNPVLQSSPVRMGQTGFSHRLTTLMNGGRTLIGAHVALDGEVEVVTNSVFNPSDTPHAQPVPVPDGHVPEALFSTQQDGAALLTRGNDEVMFQALDVNGQPTGVNGTVAVPDGASGLHMCQAEGANCDATLVYVDSRTLYASTFNTVNGTLSTQALKSGVTDVKTEGHRVYYKQGNRQFTSVVGQDGLQREYELPPTLGAQVGTFLTDKLVARLEFEGLGPGGGFQLSIHTTYDTNDGNVSRASAFRSFSINSFVVNPTGDLVGATEFTGPSRGDANMVFYLIKPDGTRTQVDVGRGMDASQHVSTGPSNGRKYMVEFANGDLEGTYILDPSMVVPREDFECAVGEDPDTPSPSGFPSLFPSRPPSKFPSMPLSKEPSVGPSKQPSQGPSRKPTVSPSANVFDLNTDSSSGDTVVWVGVAVAGVVLAVIGIVLVKGKVAQICGFKKQDDSNVVALGPGVGPDAMPTIWTNSGLELGNMGKATLQRAVNQPPIDFEAVVTAATKAALLAAKNLDQTEDSDPEYEDPEEVMVAAGFGAPEPPPRNLKNAEKDLALYPDTGTLVRHSQGNDTVVYDLKTHPMFVEGGDAHQWLQDLHHAARLKGLNVYKFSPAVMLELYAQNPEATDKVVAVLQPLIEAMQRNEDVYDVNPLGDTDFEEDAASFGAEQVVDLDANENYAPGTRYEDKDELPGRQVRTASWHQKHGTHVVTGSRGRQVTYQSPDEDLD